MVINSITGILRIKDLEFCTLDQFGLEWELQISQNTLKQLPVIGKKVRLLTYLHHKEDSMRLFGFYHQQERQMFLELLKVSGVGPKGALKILSGITPMEFIAALEGDDLTALGRLPGVGKKTAQKIVLQLKGKLVDPVDDTEFSAEPWENEIIHSLTAMGFEKKTVQTVVRELCRDSSFDKLSMDEKEKAVLKQAIIALSKS